MVAGVADARAPGEVCTDNLSIRDGGRWATYDCYKETQRHHVTSWILHIFINYVTHFSPSKYSYNAPHNPHNFTFAERFGAVPGTVLGADESRGPVCIHGETRRTLETDCVVVGEIIA